MEWDVAAATKAAYRRAGYQPQKNSPYRKKLRACSREIVEEALRVAKGNVARTARSLGIDRDTVYEAVSRE
jgi:DNA-binding NtrC family response regulator